MSTFETTRSLRVVIVDDEPLARVHLRKLLEAQGVSIAGEAANGLQALELAEDLKPDLLLLDIQMPGMSGMQLASAVLNLEAPPVIIFVTGYSEHAIDAFDTDAVDYLVKPVVEERLARALVKARSRIGSSDLRRDSEQHIRENQPATAMKRIPVREDYSVHLVRVEDIYFATSRNRRVYLWTEAKEYRTYYTLTDLVSMLPEDRFARVHDSAIVNLDRVEELILLGNHSYVVRLSNAQQIPVGRTRYAELQRKLGIDSSRNLS